MNVFDLRDQLVRDYSRYVIGFIQICDAAIRTTADREREGGLLWPNPLIQLDLAFEPGGWIKELVDEGLLHPESRNIFQIKPEPTGNSKSLRLHRHQEDAAAGGQSEWRRGTGWGIEP